MAVRVLANPITFGADGRLKTVEKDTPEEIAQCVEMVLRTRRGSRLERTNYGVRDFVFDEISSPALIAEHVNRAILEGEPRADVIVEADPSALDDMMLRIGVTIQEVENG